MKDGLVMPNMNSAFITNIVNREVKAQAQNQYREPIRDTVYTRYGVVSAVTNPETSVNHQALYANCRVTVEFQIVDLTTVRVETLSLNQDEVQFTVTRRLTGSCYQPTESITVSEPVVLTAGLEPEHPFYEQVSWKDTESGKNLLLEPSGANRQNCRLTPGSAGTDQSGLDPKSDQPGPYSEKGKTAGKGKWNWHSGRTCDCGQ